MLNISTALKSNRLLKALTGMAIKEYQLLLPVFEKLLYEGQVSKKRQRVPGGGRKGCLRDVGSKLFFILFYLKVYPTCDLGAFIFNVDRSRINRWANGYLPVLEKVWWFPLSRQNFRKNERKFLA